MHGKLNELAIRRAIFQSSFWSSSEPISSRNQKCFPATHRRAATTRFIHHRRLAERYPKWRLLFLSRFLQRGCSPSRYFFRLFIRRRSQFHPVQLKFRIFGVGCRLVRRAGARDMRPEETCLDFERASQASTKLSYEKYKSLHFRLLSERIPKLL